jgi:hypothetical protein
MYTQDKKLRLGIAGIGIGKSLGVAAVSLVPLVFVSTVQIFPAVISDFLVLTIFL